MCKIKSIPKTILFLGLICSVGAYAENACNFDYSVPYERNYQNIPEGDRVFLSTVNATSNRYMMNNIFGNPETGQLYKIKAPGYLSGASTFKPAVLDPTIYIYYNGFDEINYINCPSININGYAGYIVELNQSVYLNRGIQTSSPYSWGVTTNLRAIINVDNITVNIFISFYDGISFQLERYPVVDQFNIAAYNKFQEFWEDIALTTIKNNRYMIYDILDVINIEKITDEN